MVALNGRNLTLTPGIAGQVAALPTLCPALRRGRNANAQAGSSRDQVFFNVFFQIRSLIVLKIGKSTTECQCSCRPFKKSGNLFFEVIFVSF